jgi:glycosyltransferase involved in cell wall biosynthesis
MRICLISGLFEPYIVGGAEVYLQALATDLAREHTVSVITTAPYTGRASLQPRRERLGPLEVYRFYPLNVYHNYQRPHSALRKAVWFTLDAYNAHARWAVRQALEQIRPDVVHTHILRGLSLSVWRAVHDLRLPLVHTLHDYYLLCHYSTLMHGPGLAVCDGRHGLCRLHRPLMHRLAAGRAQPALVISPSRYVLDQHLRTGLFAAAQPAVLPHWAPPPLPSAGLTPEPGPLRVLYIGAISQHKGLRYLVQAFLQIADPDARLEIAGSGQPELSYCQSLAAGDARITFSGFLSGAAKEEAFSRANVVGVPSIFPDNLPVTILEAQLRAKAVVASHIGGIPELIEHGQTGWLVEPANVDELAAALQRLSVDPALRSQLGRRARESALTHSAPVHEAQLLQGYESVRRPPGPAA